MKSRITEAVLVLELHRAKYRLDHSQSRVDKIVFGEQVKQAQKHLDNYLAEIELKQMKGNTR